MNTSLVDKISNIAAIIWFFCAVVPILGVLILFYIITWSDIGVILESGFATQDMALRMLSVFVIPLSLTMLVPCFRKCLEALPWLFPFMVLFILNYLILAIAFSVLNYGYEVSNETRHLVFGILAVVIFILGRIGMCVLFKFKPLNKQ